MIHLSAIRIREIALPLKEPFRTAQSVTESRRALLLELIDADGYSTWSECVAEAVRGYSDETVDSCWDTLRDSLGTHVIKRDFPSPQELHAFLSEHYPDLPMSRAAVEMGVWNLTALKTGKSLAALLNGGRKPQDKIAAGIAIGMHDSPASLAERCRSAVAQGYHRIKIKISPGKDIDFARAARSVVPDEIDLSVDGNCSYSIDREGDVAALVALDELRLFMIEQPLSSHEENATVQSRIATPVCLDESIRTESDVKKMQRMKSGGIVNLKPGRVGGFTESIAIHDTCVAAGIPLWCGGMNETGIGRGYNIALASLPGFTLPGDLSPSSRYWIEDIVTPEWTMNRSGFIEVPSDRPGVGAEIDTARIDRLTVRETTIR